MFIQQNPGPVTHTNQVNRQTVRARPLTWQGKDPVSHNSPQWHSPVTNVLKKNFS